MGGTAARLRGMPQIPPLDDGYMNHRNRRKASRIYSYERPQEMFLTNKKKSNKKTEPVPIKK